MDAIASTVGRQTPVLALFVPLVLVFIVDGRRGLRQCWLPAVVAGVVFALGQFVSSNYLSVELTDIIASLAAAAAIVGLLRVWQPVGGARRRAAGRGGDAAPHHRRHGHRTRRGDRWLPPRQRRLGHTPDRGWRGRRRVGSGGRGGGRRDTGSEVFKAYAPYLIIIVVFSLAQIGPIETRC